MDLNEIRNIANDAGKILEEYKERYYAAKKDAEKYRWSSGTVNKGMREYNNRLYKMRYLLQVCMVADRIIDEAILICERYPRKYRCICFSFSSA